MNYLDRLKGKNLKKRALSSIPILVMVILVVWIQSWLLLIVIFVLTLIMSYEIYGISRLKQDKRMLLFFTLALYLTTGGILSITFFLNADDSGDPLIGWLPAVTAAGLGIIVLVFLYLKTTALATIGWLFLIYFVVGLIHIFGISVIDDMSETDNVANATSLLIILFFGTFTSDTSAHLVGSTLGKHKLASKISPNKTWEGLAGSFVATPLVTLLLVVLLPIEVSWYFGLLIGLALAFVGTCGDLLESKIKRFAGVKDTSNLIPGHGGVLDRFDSLAPNAIVIFWIGYFLNQ